MIRGLFLDRDGTIIEDRGDIASPDEVVFFEGTFSALARLQNHFHLIIVTNQSGVSKGTITMDEVNSVNQFVVDTLAKRGIVIQEVFVCPHKRTDNCVCIKPNPHFPYLARDRFGISLSHSYAVGDHPHDVELAHRVGGKGIYVLTGHGEKHRREVPAGTTIARDITEAADCIFLAEGFHE